MVFHFLYIPDFLFFFLVSCICWFLLFTTWSILLMPLRMPLHLTWLKGLRQCRCCWNLCWMFCWCLTGIVYCFSCLYRGILLFGVCSILTCCVFGSSRFVLNESPTRPAPSSSQGSSADGTVVAAGQGLPQPPPGMSVYAAKRVIGEAQWSAEQLEQVPVECKCYIYLCLLDKASLLLSSCDRTVSYLLNWTNAIHTSQSVCESLYFRVTIFGRYCTLYFVNISFIVFQQCKLGIVKFIEAKQVPEVETVIHLVVASSDTRHSVATAADLELRSKQR